MKAWCALIVVAALTACTAKPPAPGYRDDSPLSITTRNDDKRLAGDWQVRGYYPGDDALQQVAFLPKWQGTPAFELVTRSCEDTGDCEDVGEIWRAKSLGPNRWTISGPHGEAERELWVVWVDEGYRTAAIGAPDGRYGWVLDRTAKGGADRIKAAREILDFNGYDIGAMILR